MISFLRTGAYKHDTASSDNMAPKSKNTKEQSKAQRLQEIDKTRANIQIELEKSSVQEAIADADREMDKRWEEMADIQQQADQKVSDFEFIIGET